MADNPNSDRVRRMATGRRNKLADQIRRIDGLLAATEPVSATQRAWRRKTLREVIGKLEKRLANSMARIAMPNVGDGKRWSAMRSEIDRLKAVLAVMEADHAKAWVEDAKPEDGHAPS